MKNTPFSRCIFGTIILLASFASLAASVNLNQKNNFLVISDVHLDKSSTHTMEISPSAGLKDNDLDMLTFDKLLNEIHKNIYDQHLIAKPKFIIVLGDIVGHLRPSSTSVIESESTVFQKIKAQFSDIPIFYTFGNNDSFAANYGPFHDKNQTGTCKSPYDVATLNAGWLDGFLSTGTQCANHAGFPCLINEDKTNGYYAAYIRPGLKLISLNTVLFSPHRTQVSEQAGMDELQWLEKQLQTAEQHKETVLIAMHIPPGNNVYDHSSFWLQKEQDVFLNLIQRYQTTVIGMLGSHTHAEELKIIKDFNKNNINGLFFIAALSTSHGNEPSVKTFYYAKNNIRWALADYETFHFSAEGEKINFEKLYSYDDYYCASHPTHDMLKCLNGITVEKMQTYFSAGNKNFPGIIGSPNDIVLQITAQ